MTKLHGEQFPPITKAALGIGPQLPVARISPTDRKAPSRHPYMGDVELWAISLRCLG